MATCRWHIEDQENLKVDFSSEILLTSSSMSGAECKLWLTSLSTDTSKAAVRRSPLAHSSASWAGKVIFRGFSLEGMVHCKTCVDVDPAIPSSSKDNLIATLVLAGKSVAFERDALHGIIKWHSFLSFAGIKNGMECQWMSCLLMSTKMYHYRQILFSVFFWWCCDTCRICLLFQQCCVEKKWANSSWRFGIPVFACPCAPLHALTPWTIPNCLQCTHFNQHLSSWKHD